MALTTVQAQQLCLDIMTLIMEHEDADPIESLRTKIWEKILRANIQNISDLYNFLQAIDTKWSNCDANSLAFIWKSFQVTNLQRVCSASEITGADFNRMMVNLRPVTQKALYDILSGKVAPAICILQQLVEISKINVFYVVQYLNASDAAEVWGWAGKTQAPDLREYFVKCLDEVNESSRDEIFDEIKDHVPAVVTGIAELQEVAAKLTSVQDFVKLMDANTPDYSDFKYEILPIVAEDKLRALAINLTDFKLIIQSMSSFRCYKFCKNMPRDVLLTMIPNVIQFLQFIASVNDKERQKMIHRGLHSVIPEHVPADLDALFGFEMWYNTATCNDETIQIMMSYDKTPMWQKHFLYLKRYDIIFNQSVSLNYFNEILKTYPIELCLHLFRNKWEDSAFHIAIDNVRKFVLLVQGIGKEKIKAIFQIVTGEIAGIIDVNCDDFCLAMTGFDVWKTNAIKNSQEFPKQFNEKIQQLDNKWQRDALFTISEEILVEKISGGEDLCQACDNLDEVQAVTIITALKLEQLASAFKTTQPLKNEVALKLNNYINRCLAFFEILNKQRGGVLFDDGDVATMTAIRAQTSHQEKSRLFFTQVAANPNGLLNRVRVIMVASGDDNAILKTALQKEAATLSTSPMARWQSISLFNFTAEADSKYTHMVISGQQAAAPIPQTVEQQISAVLGSLSK